MNSDFYDPQIAMIRLEWDSAMHRDYKKGKVESFTQALIDIDEFIGQRLKISRTTTLDENTKNIKIYKKMVKLIYQALLVKALWDRVFDNNFLTKEVMIRFRELAQERDLKIKGSTVLLTEPIRRAILENAEDILNPTNFANLYHEVLKL